MFSRRNFLTSGAAGAALLASACGQRLPSIAVPVPDRAIDIHAHIFNAKDVPLIGFLTQIYMRPADAPVETSEIEGLLKLIKFILTGGTLTAQEELAEMNRQKTTALITSHRELERQDKERLASGIEAFAASLEPVDTIGANERDTMSLIRPSQLTSDQRILARLNMATGGDGAVAALKSGRSAQSASAEQIADAIFDTTSEGSRIGAKATAVSGQASNLNFFQTLRWIALLTRNRRDILAELLRLYSRLDGGIDIFSPSLVDFELWLKSNEKVSSPASQIAVMSEIARRQSDAVILNFAPFCPLRAAVDTREGKDPLHSVRKAVESQGFAGVKLYPPLGFKPIGNQPGKVFGHKPGKKATGRELNDELMRLYHWCAEEDVPLKSHGNDSLAADVCSGANASPEYWGKVLSTPGLSDLRVNVAHFGGFEGAPAGCPAHPVSWEELAARLADKNPGIYADLGYWTEVTSINGTPDFTTVDKIKALMQTYPNLENQILYGSDWSMIGREPNHNGYLRDVKAAIGMLGVDQTKLMSGNALRYLGLDRNGKQMQRLRAFFPAGHAFHAKFP